MQSLENIRLEAFEREPHQDFMIRFGKELGKAREKLGLGLQPICDLLDVAPSSYLMWEEGKGNPTIKTLARVFRKLDLDWRQVADEAPKNSV